MPVLIRPLVKFVAMLAFVVAHATALAAETDFAAPDFTLKSLDGKNIKLSEQAGNVVLLNFWASWCGPCRKERPLLNELHEKYGALGFSVLGVNVEQDTAQARRFLADNPVVFPVLLDTENRVSQAYQVVAMPTTAIIDRHGRVRYLHKGYKDGDEKVYRKVVKRLVRE
jgi:peroxiredoxin